MKVGDFIGLQSTEYGYLEVQCDGAEGIAFWLMFHEMGDEPWYQFSFEEADKIRDFLNYWFPKESDASTSN